MSFIYECYSYYARYLLLFPHAWKEGLHSRHTYDHTLEVHIYCSHTRTSNDPFQFPVCPSVKCNTEKIHSILLNFKKTKHVTRILKTKVEKGKWNSFQVWIFHYSRFISSLLLGTKLRWWKLVLSDIWSDASIDWIICRSKAFFIGMLLLSQGPVTINVGVYYQCAVQEKDHHRYHFARFLFFIPSITLFHLLIYFSSKLFSTYPF